MNSEILKKRTKSFALRCINLCNAIPSKMPGIYISNQLMRSSLSTAANYRAACLSRSKNEFNSKISIVLEEADESLFWIEIIEEQKLVAPNLLVSIKKEAHELTRIFLASKATSSKKKKNVKQNNQK